MNSKYILINMSDMNILLDNMPVTEKTKHIVSRFKNETGGDFKEIKDILKKLPLCHACLVESQEHTCQSLRARKIGRRIGRLIERADNSSAYEKNIINSSDFKKPGKNEIEKNKVIETLKERIKKENSLDTPDKDKIRFLCKRLTQVGNLECLWPKETNGLCHICCGPSQMECILMKDRECQN